MGIYAKIKRLDQTKADLASAINNKGGNITPSTKFRDYSKEIPNLSKWNVITCPPETTNINNVNYVKKYLKNYEPPDTSSVVDFTAYFYSFPDIPWNIDNMKFTNGKNFTSMFERCKKYVIDISKWNIDNAETLRSMFMDSLATQINFCKCNLSKVTDMNLTFFASAVINLDLSGITNTYNVVNYEDMFSYCRSMETLNISNMDWSNTNALKENLFNDCRKLTTVIWPKKMKFKDRSYFYLDYCPKLTRETVMDFVTKAQAIGDCYLYLHKDVEKKLTSSDKSFAKSRGWWI